MVGPRQAHRVPLPLRPCRRRAPPTVRGRSRNVVHRWQAGPGDHDGLFELDEPAPAPVTPERPAATAPLGHAVVAARPGGRAGPPAAAPRCAGWSCGARCCSTARRGPGRPPSPGCSAGVGGEALRGAVGTVLRGQGAARGDRRRPAPPRLPRPADRVSRRGAPVLQDAAEALGSWLVLLVAATTENPSFSVVSPLLSRSLVLQLHSLTEDDVRPVVAPRGGRGRWTAPSSSTPKAKPRSARGCPAGVDRAGAARRTGPRRSTCRPSRSPCATTGPVTSTTT